MKKIHSSMAGIVSNLLVDKGDKIKVGQEVIMLESMKMQIPIESEMEGTVIEIKVNNGDFINEGDVLLVVK